MKNKLLLLLIGLIISNCVFMPDYSKNFKKYPSRPDLKSISLTKPEGRFEMFATGFYYILAANLIEENLKYSELFSEVKEKDGDYILTAEKIDDKYTGEFLDVAYSITVEYSLYLKNRLVFKNKYSATAISEPTEHFMYAFRQRLARERALQITVNKFLDDLESMKILK
ncbi:hypothetical protein CLV96_3977 [Leptospira meyeri]|uniref:Uncharacterized protein n=1 Tax=Leptospira meyeri TaxID=29508 RepID=A0A4R8MII9_LEPME|nr:hypothetical protein [Leptospira meyeri]TDY66260.1 hypothetical protein CLV96_3977 [Leptospira meyeri]